MPLRDPDFGRTLPLRVLHDIGITQLRGTEQGPRLGGSPQRRCRPLGGKPRQRLRGVS